ncbi:MAG: hypothetical protein LBG90_02345 [Spirochaetaceae bacterium]|jgi:hypothetical protein|nr:hypothetical protein [Spirochaetaceae bacterium]
MPKKKDETTDTQVVRIRLPVDVKDRCTEARLTGTHRREAESSFLGYLLELGLTRYKKVIQPLENSEDGWGVSNTSEANYEEKNIYLKGKTGTD